MERSPLYLVEYYTKGPEGQGGWDIKFAWLRAESRSSMVDQIVGIDPTFDEIIKADEQAEIFSLRGTTDLVLPSVERKFFA